MDKLKQHDFASSSVYNTARWRKVKATVKKLSGGLCTRCLAQGLYRPATTVHHKIELTPDNINDPGICFGIDNLEALCDEHHLQAHGKLQKRYEIDPLTGTVLF